MAVRKKSSKKAVAKKKNLSPREERRGDPLYGLMPYEIIEYTPMSASGEEGEVEIHIILPHTYEKDKEATTSYNTLNVTDGEIKADMLFIQSKKAHRVSKVSDKYEVKLKILSKKASLKLVKKRKG